MTTTTPQTVDLKTLESAAAVPVFSETGESVTFGSLFEKQKTIVVFIRHFLCGLCQAYVEELGTVQKSALDAAGTRIVVIGCGDWSVIKQYKADANNFPYEIYAEPTRKLHRILDLGSGLKGAPANERKSYVPNVFTSTLASIGTGLTRLHLVLKMGNFSQLGGEFVLGPGLEVTYAWRMRNSQDHAEVAEVMQAAGVEYHGDKATTTA